MRERATCSSLTYLKGSKSVGIASDRSSIVRSVVFESVRPPASDSGRVTVENVR